MATGTPRHTWVDHASGGTLITAAKLNELEQDVADARATANGAQPSDADLTTIAALDAATAGVLATDGSGWIRKTYAQLKTALGIGVTDLTATGTKSTTTFLRGDNTWAVPAGTADMTGVLYRVVHNGTSYPARPSGVAAGYVDWVGPTQPTGWLTGDTWTDTTP